VTIWDAVRGREILALGSPMTPPDCLCFDAEGKRLAASGGFGNGFGSVTIFDAENGKELQRLQPRGQRGNIQCMGFSRDGRWFAVGDIGRMLRVWDVQRGKELHTLFGHSGRVNSVSFTPDGKRLASGSADGTVRIWDTQRGESVLVLKGHTGEVLGVRFTSDGKRLVSVCSDGVARIWEATADPAP
jgi:WD40 repeat protein